MIQFISYTLEECFSNFNTQTRSELGSEMKVRIFNKLSGDITAVGL